jgi:hypothetical protein
MPANYSTEPLKLGTLVTIRDTGFGLGRITEFRGPLGPNGARVYRIRVGKKPSTYTEVLEEQLEAVPSQKSRHAGSHGP